MVFMSQKSHEKSHESERQQRMHPIFKPFELGPWSPALKLAREFIHPIVEIIYRRGDEEKGDTRIPSSGGKGA